MPMPVPPGVYHEALHIIHIQLAVLSLADPIIFSQRMRIEQKSIKMPFFSKIKLQAGARLGAEQGSGSGLLRKSSLHPTILPATPQYSSLWQSRALAILVLEHIATP